MNKGIILGIDFSADYTQVSILSEGSDAETTRLAAKAEEFLMPTSMFLNSDLGEWAVGYEAYNRSRVEDGVFIEHIADKMQQSHGVLIGEKRVDWTEIAPIFFTKVIEMAIGKSEDINIRSVVISVDDPEETIMETLYATMNKLGFEKGVVRIINHSESLAYYVLNQSKDVWVNNVLMVDFNEVRPVIRKLFVTKGREPFTVDIVKEDISDKISYKMLDTEEGQIQADNILKSILMEELDATVVSGIYLNGQGFMKEGWYQRTINAVYSNRRLFAGNNLIAKGAIFAAKELFITKALDNYVISCKGRTKVNVTMDVVYRGQETRVILSKAGLHWYEAGAKQQCIINNVDEAVFSISWPATKKIQTFTMSLDEFPKRDDKTSRIEVSLSYTDENTFVVEIKDIGFGEFYEATDAAVRYEVKL